MTIFPSRFARGTRRRTIAAGGAIAAAAITVLALALDDPDPRDKQGSRSAATVELTTPGPVDESLLALARRDSGDALAVGRADAPVVMIEYSDFQCPFCGRFARETEPELNRSHVDRGVLRIEWRNFPVFGEESEQAARGRLGRRAAEEVLGVPRGGIQRTA